MDFGLLADLYLKRASSPAHEPRRDREDAIER
jgi:hypothetical protein